MNIPIAFGFLFTAPTVTNIVFFQWLNQSYNASLNYANRNASSNYEPRDIAFSYAVAASSAVGIGLLIRRMLASRIQGSTGGRLAILNGVSSFFGIASAGFLNAYFMRSTEMRTGIDVLDMQTHEPLGKSQITAKTAVL